MPREQAPPPPAGAVRDYPCEKGGHPMAIRQSWQKLWFYGCTRWPDCNFTFDAEQETGAPILHTRRGIPFRAPVTTKRDSVLWEALRTNAFDPAAGQKLKDGK